MIKNKLSAIIIIILITTIISGCKQDINNPKLITTNERIIKSKGFYVNSDSTQLETSVRGTVFITGKEGIPEHVQIVAFVEIDSNDWGGVGFHLTDQWNVVSITSSYPENKPEKIPEHYTSIWTMSGEANHGWNHLVEIGRDVSRWTPTGGGKGTVVIELEINEETESTLDEFRMSVGVGSREKDGKRSINPDWKIVNITIP